MPVTIATWNINSVRLRQNLVRHFIEGWQPDVVCLQEIKCQNNQFPARAFRRLGYRHQAVHGQKGYHGVAILSRLPLQSVRSHDFCAMGDCRHLEVEFAAGGRFIRLHNLYVPAGGDEPDPAINPKFEHKLRFVSEMEALGAVHSGMPSLLVGDLNIAPLASDVWSHRQLLNVVSHTPVETEGLTRVFDRGGWRDLVRDRIPADRKVFTWWSYRARDWAASDRGRRLDHVWAAPDLADRLIAVEVVRQARGWERPSDHVPVVATLDL
ncbi:MAG: exodeoxyribonuclease III [Alphaproteobacteria bacterium]|nr:MAG: exodeoxyribonuclease III [Alphaproteobacteria bacterium]